MSAEDAVYRLSDRYDLTRGRVFMTGIQALTRLPMMQRQLDVKRGFNTAGLISGYRGSPLGGYDQELWRSRRFLERHDVSFEPGINEDLGAAILWGAQLIDYYREDAVRDGVFTYWYGKAHGVDRSADVFRQANIQGTARRGGVLAFIGDDHNAESSMFSHQTDQIMESVIMPVIVPSSVEEFLSLGLLAMEMSRFSGLWVGFKTITEVVESAASFDLPGLPDIVIPPDFPIPPHGLNFDVTLSWPAQRLEYERRMIEERVPAAQAFAYANRIDRVIFQSPRKRYGIVTTGKAHADLMAALKMAGLNEAALKAAGISLFKVGMSWPLEPRGIREFAEGMESLFVVEEKRPQLEKQIKEQLYNWPQDARPEIVGKRDRHGNVLMPEIGVFTPELVVSAIARWLDGTELSAQLDRTVSRFGPAAVNQSDRLVTRAPYFCSGCPHNTSTRVPDGSIAGAGIGCHIMVLGQGRRSETFTHMGGEGMHWVGLHRYSKRSHMFQNLGDGTYQHSGSLAIRQAVISGASITYKILYNDAVAMVGGQPVEGTPSPGMIAQQLLAEGVRRVALVSDNIDAYRSDRTVPSAVTRHDRAELDQVQRELRDVAGVTAIIYEQTCAAEKRRRRKKGLAEDPARRMFINDRVCEGCGDCSVQSNCISIEPKETPYGRKRQINQSSCNKDYACADGFCPSFVSVVGGQLRQPDTSHIAEAEAAVFQALPEVTLPVPDDEYAILVAGIGGMGVLTIGGILSMAAHLEGKGATTLDFTGLSQKNGAVTAHVKIAPAPEYISVPRIADGGADLLLGCDMVAAARSIAKLREGKTRSVINTAEVPVAAFTRNNDMYFPARETREEFRLASDPRDVLFVDASLYAEQLFGDTIATNLFMVGYAFQKGLLPLAAVSVLQAIRLNAVAVDFNQRAFQWGRVAGHDLSQLTRLIARPPSGPDAAPASLDQLIADRAIDLEAYQNRAYADRYRDILSRVREHERARLGSDDALSPIAARYLYKLMAYKDEYEVARLYSDPAFRSDLASRFAGDYKIKYHLAPPLLSPRDPSTGKPVKREFGSWMRFVFAGLRRLKGLRATPFDPFGYTAERRSERRLIEQYIAFLDEAMPRLTSANQVKIRRLLSMPEEIRGYGHVKDAAIEAFDSRWSDQTAGLALTGRTPAIPERVE